MSDQTNAIDALQWEERRFPPPDDFKRQALVTDTGLYDDGNEDYHGFWANQAADLLTWRQEWTTICEWELPYSK